MKVFGTVTFFLLSVCCFAQQLDTNQLTYTKNVIAFLAADELLGRAAGSEQETIAANFIINELKKNKRVKVSIQKFQFQSDSALYNSKNIIGFVNNHSKKTILISAHYDHLGLGGTKSLSTSLKEVHNGADDNASGVALLLSLAKAISNEKSTYNYLFVFYSGHELGLFGSNYFAEHLKKSYKTLTLNMNFDMVGRLNNDNFLYFDCSPEIEKSMNEMHVESIKTSKSVLERINVLDTKWLSIKEIPSITFSTGRHIDYHKVTDDIAYINFEGLAAIDNFLQEWLNSSYFQIK